MDPSEAFLTHPERSNLTASSFAQVRNPILWTSPYTDICEAYIKLLERN